MFNSEYFADAWPLIFVFIAAGYFYVIIKSRLSCRQQVLPPPGNFGYPIVGETFALFTTPPDKFVTNHRKKYGDIFSSYLIRNPTIIVSTIDANKFFLEQEGSKFCKASKMKSMRNTLGPNQVNQASDELHRRFYKLILAHMVPEVLKQKVQKIDEFARTILHGLSEGVPTVMRPEMEKFTFLGIASLVCDELELDPQNLTTQKILNDIRALTKGIVSLPVNIPFCVYFKALQARKRLISFFKTIIRQRREHPETWHADLLQTLLDSKEDGRALSTNQVVDNCIACLFAGHHTSALTMVWIMKFLHENPKVLEDLKDEHMRITKTKGGGDNHLTWEDCQDMRLTWMVIQETLRLSNVPPAVIREITQDVIYQGFRFPKGWNMILNFSATHLNEQHFPDPHVFDPYRFKVSPKRGSYTPFGAGSRTCAGRELSKLEMLVFVHRLVTTYKWEPIETNKGVSYQMLPSLEDGYPVRLYKL